ncbi:MFS general substrate transporter [Sistotremastrum niveocremeum HHB9708]|uniref:MFS general substrate transporter n=2 Tax=Sistotremastraceae TaxID=3402574 RepID=A0A164UHQ0_9AGAM|nr:MFS general substrate transporter [Sistotremastrum niveocremeum HHB9708]KZT36045.1 MFS general substrate transporter [Sistotremastrum suecicum HHB10207 ss-3]
MQLKIFSRRSTQTEARTRPVGLKWRSSDWYITFVVGYGIATDLLVYNIIVPVIPFRLESLGYDQVSARTGWLLFAFSAGLALSTPPIAYISERFNSRRGSMIGGVIFLIVSQVIFMEAPLYWVMCLARVLQGVSSTMIWSVGLALLCDTVAEPTVGRQLGFAMTGLSIGLIVAPPIGGVLYTALGFRAPFVFGIVVAAIDLFLRIVIIERKVADKWLTPSTEEKLESPNRENPEGPSVDIARQTEDAVPVVQASESDEQDPIEPKPETEGTPKAARLSSLKVMAKLLASPRAMTALLNSLIYGIVWAMLEPTLPLRLQAVYGYTSQKVGIIYLAPVVPTLFSGALAGWLTDRHGAQYVTIIPLLAAVPWWLVLAIRSKVSLFIVALAMAAFLSSSVVSPLTAELASVARTLEGVGYAHVYGSFNLAYGVGSGIGPLLGGQIYDHVEHGWTVVCALMAGFTLVAAIMAFGFSGEVSVARTIWRATRRSKRSNQIDI